MRKKGATNMLVQAGFDTGIIGPINVTVSSSMDGFFSFTMNGRFFPYVSGTISQLGNAVYRSAIDEFVANLNVTSSQTFSWSCNQQDVAQDPKGTPFSFDVSVGSGTFRVMASNNLDKIFGFPSDTETAVTGSSISSVIAPHFIWKSTEISSTNFSFVYEENVSAKQAVTDDNRVFSLTADNKGEFNYCSFEWMNEERYRMFNYSSASLEPYTWQKHIESVRSYQPWLVFPYSKVNSATPVPYEHRNMTLIFQPKAANFKPEQTFKGSSRHWTSKVIAKVLSVGDDGICSL